MWAKEEATLPGVFCLRVFEQAAIGKYVGCWKVQGYCGGNNSQDDSHRPTTLLLDELLIKPRAHKARQ